MNPNPCRQSSTVNEKSANIESPAPAMEPHNSAWIGSFNVGSRQVFLLSLLLFTLVVWVFLPALRGDFIQYDDSSFITENSSVRTGLAFGNITWALRSMDCCTWQPVTWWSHMLDCQLYGLNP